MQYKYSNIPLLHCLLLTITFRFAFTINPWFSEQHPNKSISLLARHQGLCCCVLLCTYNVILSRKVPSYSYSSIAPETCVFVCLLCSPLKCTLLLLWEFSRGTQHQCISSFKDSAAKVLQQQGLSVYCPSCTCSTQHSKAVERFLQVFLRGRIGGPYMTCNGTTSTLWLIRHSTLSIYLDKFCSRMAPAFQLQHSNIGHYLLERPWIFSFYVQLYICVNMIISTIESIRNEGSLLLLDIIALKVNNLLHSKPCILILPCNMNVVFVWFWKLLIPFTVYKIPWNHLHLTIT